MVSVLRISIEYKIRLYADSCSSVAASRVCKAQLGIMCKVGTPVAFVFVHPGFRSRQKILG
jgi:hypothetical protein